ncbi:MAG: hypothetical protein LBP41_03350 [Holosporaceae bacterium]|jgi:hypothetical protein|nr:hypothetical protein [Holosporaceae bacterium]
MLCNIKAQCFRLLVVIFVILPLKNVNCLVANPVTFADAGDLLFCLNLLTNGNAGRWTAARANGGGQTLRNHLFQNHNGAVGHTAVVQANGIAYANDNAIANAVALIVTAVNNEILRRVNNTVGPALTFQNLANNFNNLPLQRQNAVLAFFNSHTKRGIGAAIRRFGISLQQGMALPAAVQIRKIPGTVATAPQKLWIYLPAAAQLATTPETVYLD